MERDPSPITLNALQKIGLAAGLTAVALTGCTNQEQAHPEPIETSISPTPLEIPTETPTPKPSPEKPAITMQKMLNTELVHLGMPELELDGKIGPQTRRAICTIRLLTGDEASLEKPTSSEIRALSNELELSSKLSGFVISRTCQIMAVNLDSKIRMVIPISSGKPGHTTPAVDNKIQYGRFGWHNSSLYPEEKGNGNMYDPLYFNGAIAVHGSNEMYPSVTTPRSHGCVRVTVSNAKKLWELAGGPQDARQDQYIGDLKPIPVHVI
jgi:lipoprotein-anchoring transpeptidase ErfK/SrfK